MLSIAIPTYNYSAYELVSILDKQCKALDIKYEIIVQDDASTNYDYIIKNELINKLDNCLFTKNEYNLGRAKNRNYLIQKAKFQWILLLDCDTEPVSEYFISNYLTCIETQNPIIVFGGINYQDLIPNPKETLRWKYGKEREAISVDNRIKNPYTYFLTSNILVNKSLFDKISFNEEITQYGYEDLVFAKELEKNEIKINHIDNPVYHLNLETSEEFLHKTEKSLQTLLFLEESDILANNITKLQKTYKKLKWWKLDDLFFRFYKKLKNKIVTNLLSEKPKLFYFDLYKLGYFMILKSKN